MVPDYDQFENNDRTDVVVVSPAGSTSNDVDMEKPLANDCMSSPSCCDFRLPGTARASLSVPLSSAARLAPPPHPVECLTSSAPAAKSMVVFFAGSLPRLILLFA